MARKQFRYPDAERFGNHDDHVADEIEGRALDGMAFKDPLALDGLSKNAVCVEVDESGKIPYVFLLWSHIAH